MDANTDVQQEWSPADRGRHVVSRKYVLKAGVALAGASALPVLDAAGTALAGNPARATHGENRYPQDDFRYHFVQIPYGLVRKAQEL